MVFLYRAQFIRYSPVLVLLLACVGSCSATQLKSCQISRMRVQGVTEDASMAGGIEVEISLLNKGDVCQASGYPIIYPVRYSSDKRHLVASCLKCVFPVSDGRVKDGPIVVNRLESIEFEVQYIQNDPNKSESCKTTALRIGSLVKIPDKIVSTNPKLTVGNALLPVSQRNDPTILLNHSFDTCGDFI